MPFQCKHTAEHINVCSDAEISLFIKISKCLLSVFIVFTWLELWQRSPEQSRPTVMSNPLALVIASSYLLDGTVYLDMKNF